MDRSIEVKCWDVLKGVKDPEFPVSVVDMGLIYDIQVVQDTAKVTMTYTSTACACMEWIQSDIEQALLTEDGIKQVKINVVWDPPWSTDRLSEEAKQQLSKWGVST
jgi:metal-sulfur cluster biosynthetic enzyme